MGRKKSVLISPTCMYNSITCTTPSGHHMYNSIRASHVQLHQGIACTTPSEHHIYNSIRASHVQLHQGIACTTPSGHHMYNSIRASHVQLHQGITCTCITPTSRNSQASVMKREGRTTSLHSHLAVSLTTPKLYNGCALQGW